MRPTRPLTSTFTAAPAPARARARRALWLIGIAVPAAVLSAAGAYVWNGPPYPPADPDQVAARLKQQSQRVYDEVALPGRPEVISAGVETGACYYRGLRSIAHIDRGRPDVRSFRLEWRLTDVPRDTARSGQDRVRDRLERQGWRLTSENTMSMGFRYEHPETGDMVDVDWYESTGTLAVSAYAPCGKLPDGFDAHHWPAAGWSRT